MAYCHHDTMMLQTTAQRDDKAHELWMSTPSCLSKLSAAVSIRLSHHWLRFSSTSGLAGSQGLAGTSHRTMNSAFFLNLLDLPDVLPEFFFGLAVLYLGGFVWERQRIPRPLSFQLFPFLICKQVNQKLSQTNQRNHPEQLRLAVHTWDPSYFRDWGKFS